MVVGDLTRPDSMGIAPDAIVNAANEDLAAGGGVCGAIFAAAGHDRLRDACRLLGGCATGSAVSTPAFDLSERGVTWILHAVGPRYDLSDPEMSATLLEATYRSILAEAGRLGVRCVAIPAISTGIFGFPADKAAAVAAHVVTAWVDDPAEIILVAYDEHARSIVTNAVAEAQRS